MQEIKLLIIFLSASVCANAQQDPDAVKQRMVDSIKEVRTDEAALLYPRIRQFSITHQDNMAGNIHSKRYGNDFFKGRFKSSRTTINMNVPIINRDKNILVASLGVVHQFFDLNEVANYDVQRPVSARNTYIPMMSAGISYSRRDTLFGRAVNFTASVNGLFNPSFSRRQFSFTGLVSVPILRTEKSNLMGGIIVSLDPSSPVPLFPFLSYYHKFRSLDIDLMADVPSKVALRKQVLKNISVTAFSELIGSNSFFGVDKANATLPQQLTYSSLEIKSGLLLEYRLTKKAVLNFSGGMNATVTSKIREKNKKPADYFIKNSNSAVPYLQVGIALLPFWKPFK